MTDELSRTIVSTYLKQLRLTRMATDCEAMVREAEERGLGYLGFLQALLEGELAHRQEQQLRQRLKAAAFPYQKRLEDFDFSLIPCVSKVRLLELAQGAFLANHDNVLFIGPSGIGKTHLLMGLGRSLCLAGYRVLFRTAVTLATELELAHKELQLPRLLASYRRFDLILVDELGYLPFAKQTAELLFQFFSDRYERASVALTSNLAFAQWTQVFGNEQMTAALLDRLVHRSHILTMEGESFRFRQSFQKQDPVS
ncbi:MAG TPA: IS21-like element helper ATPase IstB [Ktedonobacteraceae bacterium]|nr:IS21-like element helper ATPase IstB [Ktedonobacteraceae bacterium]